MQFGIFDIMQVPPEVPAYRAYNEHMEDAVLADELGLDYHFIAERHFMALYRTPSPSPWLGALAAKTKRIRIGALGYIVPLHNPVRLAEDVSMLDHLSMGRMEVGIGLGHRPEELVSLGIEPGLRQAMMMESLLLMRKAWMGQSFDFPGKVFSFKDIRVERTIQVPHPPLWYAGNNPQAATWASKNLISLALGFQPDEQLQAPADAFHDQREEDKREPGRRPFLALMRHLYVAESDDQARSEMIEDLQRIGQSFAASPRELARLEPEELPDRDKAEAQLDELLATDVVIGGSPETCANRLAETSRNLGLDVFLANPYLTGLDPERIQRTIRLYAEQVVPAVREMVD